jgi:hypothetical protein
MPDLLQRLSHVDLESAVSSLLGFLDSVDPCFLGLIVAVFVVIGSRMVVGQPSVQSWGLRLAAATFLLYGGYLWFSGKADEGIPLWKLALRCGCVAGIVLAIAWIVLPVLSFVHRRLRLALAVFLGYGGYVALSAGEMTAEHWPTIALQALAVTGLALVVAWIVDPFWSAIARHLLPCRFTSVDEPASGEPPVPFSPGRQTPLSPGPIVKEIEATRLVISESQRRRDRARMQLELAYLQGQPVISTWLPRPMFDDFLRRHLGDHLSSEEVESNARQLLAALGQHQDQVQGRAKFVSFEELADWLLAEQQRIQSMALEQPLKQTQLIDLHQRDLNQVRKMVQQQHTLALQ